MEKFQFHLPTEIHFGTDIIQEVGEKARLSDEKVRKYAETSRDSDEFNSISPNEITIEYMENIYRRALL